MSNHIIELLGATVGNRVFSRPETLLMVTLHCMETVGQTDQPSMTTGSAPLTRLSHWLETIGNF